MTASIDGPADDGTSRVPLDPSAYIGMRVAKFGDRIINNGLVVRAAPDQENLRGWVVVAHTLYGRERQECMYPPLIEWAQS